ncbi:hypothetical protein [Cellulomonas sp. Root137]|uniref:hypothetical protein n=1 Tax=Cellulomonas sp. Root137 TaxID=1736459 RepID=UPI0006FCD1E1|nr:hypothetical protein [Cellulomonas sp. Root137]KQY44068.1 hypothetical protein ASD18_17185 [Cellulomonas sp. Root137]
MGGAKKSTWIGGTVFIGLVIAAAAWFLAISPTMSAASEIRSEAQSTRERNELLELKVTKLRSDFEKLPEYRAELAGIQLQIPTDAMLSDYLRQLDMIAIAHSVTLTAVTPSVPQSVVLAVPAVTAPVPEATEESGSESDEAAVAPATTAGANGPAGFTAIPFSLTALGTYDNTLAFLNDLQNSTQRLFLVTGFTATAQDQQDAGSGKPATAVGDQELIITGYTYALPDALAVPPAVDPAAAPPVLPGATPGKNPLVPVAGR